MSDRCPRCGKKNPAEIHTCTPLALRLADWLSENTWRQGVFLAEAAAELRRLHEVNAELVEALNDIINEVGDGFIPHKLFVDQGLAALAKAKGESNAD